MCDKTPMHVSERNQLRHDLLLDARRDALDAVGDTGGVLAASFSFEAPGLKDPVAMAVEYISSALVTAGLDALISSDITGERADEVLVQHRELLRRAASKIAVVAVQEGLEIRRRIQKPDPIPFLPEGA